MKRMVSDILADDVALQATNDLALGLTLRGAPGYILLGTRLASDSVERDHVQRPVGVSVAMRVEAVPHGLAGGGFYGRRTAQVGKGGLAVQPCTDGTLRDGRSAAS
jgi:hypothetical protein